MKIQTFTVVAGSMACNARCPFCVAKQTPEMGVPNKEPDVNWRNFQIGIDLAKAHNVTTALITSKGEATLFPDQLEKFVYELGREFPLVELQTNALVVQRMGWAGRLRQMYEDGLTTVAISVAHWDNEINRQIYTPHKAEYPDLASTIHILHAIGLSVRLSVTMNKGIFDSAEDVDRMVWFAEKYKVEQLTLRPVALAGNSRQGDVRDWTEEHLLTNFQLDSIVNHVEMIGTKVMTLDHGGVVYDYGGQNLCLTDCLTINEESDDLRQLIFFPDGALRYDWRYEGARLL